MTTTPDRTATPADGWPHGMTGFERRFGNATTRVVMGAIGIPIVLGAVWLGGWAFFLFVLAITIGAVLEFYWIAEKKGAMPHKGIGVFFSALVVFAFFHGQSDALLLDLLPTTALFDRFYVERPEGLYLFIRFIAILAPLLLLGVVTLIAGMLRSTGSPIVDNSVTITGVAYVALFLATLVGIRQFFLAPGTVGSVDVSSSYGFYMVMATLSSIWICDSGAYYAGRAFGKHKLFERVSPKKTWEGAIGGAIAAVGAMIGFKYWLLTFLTLGDAIVLGLIVGIFGQIGDLAESHMKRDAGVKDSSAIIPGHGGIFDRFDSLLFVAPLVYLYLNLFVGIPR